MKMIKITNIQAAAAAGKATAEYITKNNYTDQWGLMLPMDDLPAEDYRTLSDEYGDVTPEMDAAYKKSFNSSMEESLK